MTEQNICLCPHCNTHIDEHEANACFNAWVATDVMGYTIEKRLCSPSECGWSEIESIYTEDELGLFSLRKLAEAKAAMPERIMWCILEENDWWEPMPSFSEFIAVAWQVLEKFSKWALYAGGYVMLGDRNDGKEWKAHALKIPHAICRAAIKAHYQGE